MAFPTFVLTGPEERLLAALADIEVDRNLRRDLPPELSLPEVAKRLGVVRSALHNPVSSLESKGLLDRIKSNVIGEARKRTVLLITQRGLDLAHRLEGAKQQSQKGPTLFGRNSEVEQICGILDSPGVVIITGLPGIGKSSVAKMVGMRLQGQNKDVRWHEGSRLTSTMSLIDSWASLPVSEDLEKLEDCLDPDSVYILDEAQEIHRRHAKNIKTLIENVNDLRIILVTRSPSTFSSLSNAKKVTLEGLDIGVATRIATHLEEPRAKQVAIALGGHPLAIQMWREGDEVPAPGTPVADFVSSNILDRLDPDTAEELAELTIEPFPVRRGDSISNRSIDHLDNAAILKWSGPRFEAHHLIRHVRQASLDEAEVKSIHKRLSERWSEIEGIEARGHEMHHRVLSGQSISNSLAEEVLEKLGPAAASTLLSDALDHEERDDLRILSAQAALALGEPKTALGISEGLSEEVDRLRIEMEGFRLLGQESKYSEAENSLLSMLDEPEKSRVLVRGAVRLYDDRLPGPISKDLGDRIVQRLDRIEADPGQLDGAILSSSLILKYLVASNLGDAITAASLRSEIAGLLGEGHRRLQEIDLRLRLRTIDDIVDEEIELRIQETEGKYEKLRIIHWVFAALGQSSPDWLIASHKSIFLRDEIQVRREHLRIEAFSWYWRGFYDRDQRLRYWSEAASLLRSCGCSNASSRLIELIYGEVRSPRQ